MRSAAGRQPKTLGALVVEMVVARLMLVGLCLLIGVGLAWCSACEVMEKARRKAVETTVSPRRGQAQVPTNVSKFRDRLLASAEKDSVKVKSSPSKGSLSTSKGLDTRPTQVQKEATRKRATTPSKGEAEKASKKDSKGASSSDRKVASKLTQRETTSSKYKQTLAEVKDKKTDAVKKSIRKAKQTQAEFYTPQNHKEEDSSPFAGKKKVEIGFKNSTVPGLPPGVYFDDRTIGRTEPTFPIDSEQQLLGAGPFGIGEAKACLDDLQATLLNYYGKLYRIEPSMPLDWQIEQLRRSYYPSPEPISGQVDHAGLAVDLGQLAGALPPPFPNGLSGMTPEGKIAEVSRDGKTLVKEDATFVRGSPVDRRDEAKTKLLSRGKEVAEGEKIVKEAIQKKKSGGDKREVKTEDDGAKQIRRGREKSLSYGISEVIGDLHEIAESNLLGINKLEKEIDREIGDPTSRYFYRGDAMPRGLRRPVYYSNRNERGHMNELENHVETLYRNLLTRSEWNKRKIRLMQDKMKLITASQTFRQDPRSAF